MSHKKSDEPKSKNESFRQKAPIDENNYFVHMPLTLRDKYDISCSTSRDQAFIQEYLYIYLIVKYKGKVPSVMYEEWKASLLNLKIAVEVSSQEETQDNQRTCEDGMVECRLYAAQNQFPEHTNTEYFLPQVTNEGHVLFPLCTSLGNLSPNSKKTKLLFTGIHKQDKNVDNIIDSFVNGRNINNLIRNPVEFKVYVDIKLINPLKVYCSYIETAKHKLLQVMVTNTIQMVVFLNKIEIFPNKTDSESDCIIREISDIELPAVVAPLEQFVFVYKLIEKRETTFNKYCAQISWTAEPVKSRGQSIVAYYELQPHLPD